MSQDVIFKLLVVPDFVGGLMYGLVAMEGRASRWGALEKLPTKFGRPSNLDY